jgi:hypothetical protein
VTEPMSEPEILFEAHAAGARSPRDPGSLRFDRMRIWPKYGCSTIVKSNAHRLVSDRRQEHVCEETDDKVVLTKDPKGCVIGFEKLNFSDPERDRLRVAVETTPT